MCVLKLTVCFTAAETFWFVRRLLGVPEGLIDQIILHVSGVNKVTVRAVP